MTANQAVAAVKLEDVSLPLNRGTKLDGTWITAVQVLVAVACGSLEALSIKRLPEISPFS